jgi:ABC-type amino acid transport substrate-binding protein
METNQTMTMKSAFAFLLVVLLPHLGLASLTSAKTEPLLEQDVVAFHYPPYMLESPEGDRQGLEIDILKAALKNLKITFKFNFYPIRRATQAIQYSQLNNHPIYVGTSLHFNEEIKRGEVYAVCIGRAKFVAFTFANSPITKIKNLSVEKLKKFRLATLRGSSINLRLKQAKVQAMETRTFEQLFEVLDQGKVDTSIVLDIAGEEELKKLPANKKRKIMKIPTSLFEIPLAIVISKDHPQSARLYNSLRQRLREMQMSGELRELAEKYYGKDQVPFDFYPPPFGLETSIEDEGRQDFPATFPKKINGERDGTGRLLSSPLELPLTPSLQ